MNAAPSISPPPPTDWCMLKAWAAKVRDQEDLPPIVREYGLVLSQTLDVEEQCRKNSPYLAAQLRITAGCLAKTIMELGS